MLKNAAIAFGAVLLLVGILGYFPALTPDGRLFGLFAVDGLHNLIHLLTGAAALIVGFMYEAASQLYFKVIGIIYAVIALLGIFFGNSPLLGFIAHNWADFWLHLVIAALTLYLGFMFRPAGTPHARA